VGYKDGRLSRRRGEKRKENQTQEKMGDSNREYFEKAESATGVSTWESREAVGEGDPEDNHKGVERVPNLKKEEGRRS